MNFDCKTFSSASACTSDPRTRITDQYHQDARIITYSYNFESVVDHKRVTIKVILD